MLLALFSFALVPSRTEMPIFLKKKNFYQKKVKQIAYGDDLA